MLKFEYYFFTIGKKMTEEIKLLSEELSYSIKE